jgi:hypothetical protein
MNREQWLNKLAAAALPKISSRLDMADEEPAIKLSCGFPAQQGKRNNVGAQLIPPAASDEFNAEIFVSPTIAEKSAVIEMVLPLLVAAATGDYKQGREYKSALSRVGLNTMPNLPTWAEMIAERMPDYPHAAITIPDRKKQTTRLVKVACLNDNYITRISRATVDAMGCPICPACNLEMVVC